MCTPTRAQKSQPAVNNHQQEGAETRQKNILSEDKEEATVTVGGA